MYFPRYVRRAVKHNRIHTLSAEWRMFFVLHGKQIAEQLGDKPLPGYPKGWAR